MGFGYFFGLLVEIFYIPLVDYMYDLMCNVFVGPKVAYFLGLRPFQKNVTKSFTRLRYIFLKWPQTQEICNFWANKNIAHQIIHVINQWNVKYFHKQPKAAKVSKAAKF